MGSPSMDGERGDQEMDGPIRFILFLIGVALIYALCGLVLLIQ
jgi:hypothetical protein